jgi:hypothetical protein
MAISYLIAYYIKYLVRKLAASAEELQEMKLPFRR